MDKIDNLFIRACKSNNTDRVYKIYRKFYGDYPNPDGYIAGILSDIIDRYNIKVRRTDLLNRLNPANEWMILREDEESIHYWTKILRIYITFIQLCPAQPLAEFGCVFKKYK